MHFVRPIDSLRACTLQRMLARVLLPPVRSGQADYRCRQRIRQRGNQFLKLIAVVWLAQVIAGAFNVNPAQSLLAQARCAVTQTLTDTTRHMSVHRVDDAAWSNIMEDVHLLATTNARHVLSFSFVGVH